jgi:hypothetical protein
MMSLALPAPSGTITVMLRLGQSCAEAGENAVKKTSAAKTARPKTVGRFIGVSSDFADKSRIGRARQQMRNPRASRGTLFPCPPCYARGRLEEFRMPKLLVVSAFVAGVFVFAPLNTASAFVPVQTDIAATAAAMNGVIQVKRHRHGRPHGWSRGRKVGWHGRGRPPAQH